MKASFITLKTYNQISTLTVVPESFLERVITKKRVEKLATKILFLEIRLRFLSFRLTS